MWPARSPDLTPLEYHVWGRMKELVYEEEIRDWAHLIRRIDDASLQMKEEMKVGLTTTEMRRRARVCIKNEGSHFEYQI